MDARRTRSAGLLNISDRLKRFIFDSYSLFSCLQSLFIFRDYHTDRVTNASGNAPFRNKYIPVLLDMSHLIIRHVLRCQYAKDTVDFQSLRDIDIENSGSGISGAHSGSVGHTFHFYIIRIGSVSENFRPNVHTEARFSDTEMVSFLQLRIDLLFAPKYCSRQ